MNRTCETRIERVYRADDLERFAVFRDRRADQGFFICRAVSGCVTRTGIPCARHDELIVVDLGVLDPDPVCECSTRSFRKPDALAFGRPRRRLPFCAVMS